MYNSIYPININYRNRAPYSANNDGVGNPDTKEKINPDEQRQQQSFPNGQKTAIDYSKGNINISQVLADFKNTIVAINAPQDVADEVGIYLNLVDKESHKETPSKDIIVSNLKNAAKISDTYIAASLKKPSTVVEGWIDALFLQRINLKADPNEINPDFLLQFPQQAQEKIDEANNKEMLVEEEQTPQQDDGIIISSIEEIPQTEAISENSQEITIHEPENFEVESSIEFSQTFQEIPSETQETQTITPFSPLNESDRSAKELFILAKKSPKTNQGDTAAINYLNEALGILENQDCNKNIKAAIHFERGKIFDNYDYVDYALRDYFEATKASDNNLKAQAYYKSGKVYDEFMEFDPALNNYLSSVAYSGEADNQNAQTHALTRIATLFSKQFDVQNTKNYSSLAIETAKSTNDDTLVAKTYSQSAENYKYMGENDEALDGFKNALAIFSRDDESYEQMAYNYSQAAEVMEKLGNHAKAKKLQEKANLYYQKVLFPDNQMEEAS